MGGIGDIFGTIPQIIKAAEAVQKIYGPIHKRTTAEINGKKGFLIWDYMLANEITFQRDEDGKIISFGISFSDEETEKKWNELVEKYGT